MSEQRSPTDALAAFAAQRPGVATANADAIARSCIDAVGCALAAAGEPAERIVRDAVAAETGVGAATVWTTGAALPPAAAALLNGNAAHLLDFDDISPTMPMHPTVVLLPAILAVAEVRRSTGAQVAVAYDTGSAAFRAIAQALPSPAHVQRGWHTTSTVGRLAATVAVATLVGLDIQRTRHAIGIAASLASGLLVNFGSMTKPFHAGAAAHDAVRAVDLAERGFTANADALGARGGFFEIFGEGAPAVGGFSASLERWAVQWASDCALKRYPSCYDTHRAIDAALALRELLGGRAVERIEVTVHPGGLRPLRASPPTTGTEAKFSLPYVVATALQHGRVVLSDFSDDGFPSVALGGLVERVQQTESPVPPLGAAAYSGGYAIVAARLADGTTVAERVDVTLGDARRPLSDGDLWAKFADCVGAVACPEPLFRALDALPRGGDVAAVTSALRAVRPRKGS